MDIPEQLKSPKWKLMEFPDKLSVLCGRTEHVVFGVNAVTKGIKDMAFVVIFADAGNLVSQMPTLCVLRGIPCSAVERPTPELIAALKIRRLACVGVKRSAQETTEFSELLLQVQRNLVVDDVPVGNMELAKTIIKQPASKPPKTQSALKPPAQTQAAAAKPQSLNPKKRFFSSLE
jgi:ribosomal protein L7Ae-like RNA K-turn-binding protein